MPLSLLRRAVLSLAASLGLVSVSQIAAAQAPGCPADFTGDRIVNSADFFSFLSAFFAQDPAADIADPIGVTSQDFFTFLEFFFEHNGPCAAPDIPVPIVFVSRAINPRGTIYWDAPRDLPGVGPYSRVRSAAPARLLVLEPSGSLRTLIDGAHPIPASLNIIDVSSVGVSYDASTLVFAGLPQGSYNPNPASTTGAWRLFAINADGSNLRQITFSDQSDLSLAQFGQAAGVFGAFDDYDPVFLPDGRICFSSTRYYSVGHYSGVRASNLFVVNLDGSGLHRITTERNGADRPLIDPVTGRIVYSRWWRNHRFPIDSMATIEHGNGFPPGGYEQHLGLTADRTIPVGGDSMFRNFWQIASINTDGSDVALFSGRFRSEPDNHIYGGAFSSSGDLFANFFPMFNMTEASGFGGIRRFPRPRPLADGPQPYEHVIGVTSLTLDYVHYNPTSYGVFHGNYAAEPEVLPDGRLLISWARDYYQDYGLFTCTSEGGELTPLYNIPGASELRARVLAPRVLPPIVPDIYRDDAAPAPSRLPPLAAGPFNTDGDFLFRALNVYFNAPVDWDIVSAPAVGSAGSIRFFIDHQRTSPGSFPNLDWPILLDEQPVAADGSITQTAPANVPLFEQIRTAASDGYRVPLTGGRYPDGAAHVTGLNFASAGSVASCVGCHAGHTQIPLPSSPEEARWTNLAPGAAISVSSSRDPNQDGGLTDRRVLKGPIWRYWNSAPGAQSNQWVTLTFPVPITVRAVKLYNPRPGDEANSSIQVNQSTVILFSDAAASIEVARAQSGSLAVSGTTVPFADVRARAIRVNLDSVAGTFYGIHLAALAEIEVVARGEGR